MKREHRNMIHVQKSRWDWDQCYARIQPPIFVTKCISIVLYAYT